ncbi:MAG: carboxymuconolactone decarboxylase family protein [Hyphomicrobiaceae bacterium]|nr:carboxymuconolactone decarboxylase family protein [Hyphomicrobiaceae bacterium]
MVAWVELLKDKDLPAEVQKIVPFMGMIPNSMRAYGYLPDMVGGLIDFEMALLPSGTVDTLIKARVGYVVSRLNGCRYCAAHVGGRLKNNGVEDEELACIIGDLPETGDVATDAAVAFARLATTGDSTQADIERLRPHFSTAQIVEIICVVGFYCFLNRVHTALGLEVEDPFEKLGAHRIGPAQVPSPN